MTPLATFVICILITLALILIPFFIVGSGFALLIIIFPAIAAESITGERGLDFSYKSYGYFIVLWFFIILQVLLIASVFFGFYCLFWGYPTATVSMTPMASIHVNAEKHRLLIVLNKILLLALSYFVCRFIYQIIKFRESFKSMSRQSVYLYQILPLKIFPLAFIYLIASLYYLNAYPAQEKIGLLPGIAGYIYTAYILYALGRTIFIYSRSIRHGFSGFKFNHALQLFITIAYDSTFLYFFFQLYSAIKLQL